MSRAIGAVMMVFALCALSSPAGAEEPPAQLSLPRLEPRDPAARSIELRSTELGSAWTGVLEAALRTLHRVSELSQLVASSDAGVDPAPVAPVWLVGAPPPAERERVRLGPFELGPRELCSASLTNADSRGDASVVPAVAVALPDLP